MTITPKTVGNGQVDDTDALAAWLRRAELADASMYLPPGRYAVRPGELILNLGDIPQAPHIHTAGPFASVLVAINDTNAPLLTVQNRTPSRFGYGLVLGGLGFEGYASKPPNQHGLAVSGVQNAIFGPIRADDLGGDAVHIQQREEGMLDQYHVAFTTFEGIEAVRCGGWAFNNDNGAAFNLSEVRNVRAVAGEKGLIRSGGAGNLFSGGSLGRCEGWAIERYRLGATVSREVYDRMELHGPEYGLWLDGIEYCELKRIRLIHEWHTDENQYWPRSGLRLGGVEYAATRSVDVQMLHRIDPHTDATLEGVGPLIEVADEWADLRSVRVEMEVGDHAGLGVVDTVTNPAPGVIKLTVNGVEV